MKLKFGSEQDIEDAMAIYLRQKDRMDLKLLGGFAARQGVLPALGSLKRRAKELEGAQR